MVLLVLAFVKVDVKDDDFRSRAWMTTGEDATDPTLLPSTKNLSVVEIQTLQKAIANQTVSRKTGKTLDRMRTSVEYLPLSPTRSPLMNRYTDREIDIEKERQTEKGERKENETGT